MDKLNSIRLSKANEYLKMAAVYLNDEHVELINNIIELYSEDIAYFNNKQLTVINPTKTELGLIRSALKKIVRGYYSDYFITAPEFVYSDTYKEHYKLYEDCCYCEHCDEQLDLSEKHYSKYDDINRELEIEIKNACSNTIIPEDIINAKILLRRRQPNSFQYNKLEVELNEYLNAKMLEEFINQNQEFIKNKILNHAKL